ncbi:MAG: undecaprenyl-diphosphate phosphatase [Bacilli bacterium]|nr:undecaprenyl-diphosphate phosphatase [Bacilli bacterium]
MNIKTLLKYILLSLVQGFTEPLPISSSGHMIITRNLLNIDNQDLTLEIFLNFASMLAIFIYMFTKRIHLKVILKNPNLITKLIIASIPCIIIGILFKDKIEQISINSKFIGITLLITTILLFLSSLNFPKCSIDSITNIDSLKLGIAQSVALVPGISRMGTVLSTGIFLKLNIRTILDFSFLMYLIVSIGSFILTIPNLFLIDSSLLLYYFISFIVTFIFTYFSINWFYNIINKKSLMGFSIYTLILGIILIILGK